MSSKRLPGKILCPLGGQAALNVLANRLSKARVDEWWLATTGEPEDDVTEAWGFELGLRVFRGHATDVLSRFTTIAAETGADWLVRVKADNPFLDERCVDLLVDARDSSECSKQSDLLLLHGGLLVEDEDGHKPAPRLPVGYGVELLRSDALAVAAREIPENEPHHRVHVTSWLSANAKNHAVPTPLDWPDRPDWRWTIDTYEDLAMARSAFRLFGEDALTIDYPSMVERLDAHPEIISMNQHFKRKKLQEG